MSHLDSNTLHTAPATAGPDGIPALAVSNNAGGLTTDDVVSPASNNPFLAQNGGEVVSPPLSSSSQPPTAASLDSLSGANSSSAPFSANSHSSGLSGSSGPQSATSNLSQSSKDTASSAADKANNASAQAKDTANTAAAKAKDVANNASAQAKDVANNASAQAKSTANAASNKANDIATGLRQRVNNLPSLDEVSHNPTVQNVKGAAGKQVGQLREQLGRSKFIRDLEKRTNIDRVYLVVGGILAYFLVIPLNLFGLALPTTTLLTLLPPAFLALGILEDKQSSEAGEAATRALLSYFVTLGFIQFAESLMAGFLERKIPQYYTVKLLFLAYLLHPKTQGAMKIHQNVFRPILVTSTRSHKTPFNTPPQTQSASSPTTNLSNTGVQKSFNAAGPDVGAFNSGGPGYAVDR